MMQSKDEPSRYRALTRRTILEDAFHVDDNHPGRRALFEAGMLMLPSFVAAIAVGIFLIATH